MKDERFSFLICSERSGSNFVTKILDGHSKVCGPSPIHLLRYFAPLEGGYGDLRDDAGWKNFIADVHTFFRLKISTWETDVSVEELETASPRNLASVCRLLYEKEAKANGKELVFVKENHAYKLIPYYQQHFPASKFIWAVRDPRDMALSWKKDAVLRGGVVRSANVWKKDQELSLYMHRYLGPAGKMLLVHYEALTGNTAVEAKRMTDHLGIAFEESMVTLEKSASSAKNATASAGWANLDKGVMKNNSRKYLEGLCKEEILFIEHLCREEMKALGYAPEFPEIDKAEFLDLQHRLSLEEKFEKEAYQSISEAEKEKRKNWVKWVAHLQAKF